MSSGGLSRVFKTGKFSKDARKAGILDSELCAVMRQVMVGQADDLGGGVFKKRLNDNMHRSIVLARGGCLWVYEFLFAKQHRASIDAEELAGFRLLAKGYANLNRSQLDQLISAGQFLEICNAQQA